MSPEMWNVADTISIVGYPLVAWVCWKAGHQEGMVDAIETLAERGLIDLDEETD